MSWLVLRKPVLKYVYTNHITLNQPSGATMKRVVYGANSSTQHKVQYVVFSIDRPHRIMYIRIMPSLQPYSVRGCRYWRIVESYRDSSGRPAIRVLRHLGTVEKLLE